MSNISKTFFLVVEAKEKWGRLQELKTPRCCSKRPSTKANEVAIEVTLQLPAGRRDLVFVDSMSDFFEDDHGQPLIDTNKDRLFVDDHGDVPATLTHLQNQAFELFDECQNLIFLLLTKRPENIWRTWPALSKYADQYLGSGFPNSDAADRPGPAYRRNNVWLGCSVENQEQADKRIPELLKCRDLSPVLFLSCEPLLGPLQLDVINVGHFQSLDCLEGERGHAGTGGRGPSTYPCPSIDWVIAGGESGRKARPSHPDWLRSLRDQCSEAGVPFFFKQWGEWAPYYAGDPEGLQGVVHKFGDKHLKMWRVGKKKAGCVLDGRECNEFPSVVSV